MLIDSVKNHMRPLLGRCSSDELTLQNVSDAFESLRKENYITSKLLNEYEKCTYCITDICCKFDNLTPKGMQYISEMMVQDGFKLREV